MTTILFISSMILIGVMLASKIFEIKVRRIHFLSNIFNKGDERIHRIIETGILKNNHYKKIGRIFIFEFLPSYTYEVLVRMKDHVSKRYYSAGEGFRGRRILRSNGSVSFFLERLAENKPGAKTHKA